MATQLAERPSRIERVGGDNNPINRLNNVKDVAGNITKKPITFNFICMVMVAVVLDIIGFFLSEIPGVGIALSLISNVIFIPWFYFSGIKFTGKRVGSMATTSILEYIPFIGNLPLITLNVIYSYYSE